MKLRLSRMTLIATALLVFSPTAISDTTPEQAPSATTTSENEIDPRDTMITHQIKAKLSSNSPSFKNIQINTQNGIVTITGEVDTQAQKSSVEGIVRSTPGVSSVDTQILIKPKPVMPSGQGATPLQSEKGK